jgi:hypothetical protein
MLFRILITLTPRKTNAQTRLCSLHLKALSLAAEGLAVELRTLVPALPGKTARSAARPLEVVERPNKAASCLSALTDMPTPPYVTVRRHRQQSSLEINSGTD